MMVLVLTRKLGSRPHLGICLIFLAKRRITGQECGEMNSKPLLLTARILIPAVFIGLGAERLLAAAGVLNTGAPVSAGALGFSAFELAAGLLIAFGWQVEMLSWVMAIFLTVDALSAHQFWKFSGPEMHSQLLHFLKNVSSIGGLLLLAWVAAGGKARGASAK